MRILFCFLIICLMNLGADARKDTLYLKPNIRIVYSSFQWKPKHGYTSYTHRLRKKRFNQSSYLYPGSRNSFEAYHRHSSEEVNVQSGYQSELHHHFDTNDIYFIPDHLKKVGRESTFDHDTTSKILTQKTFVHNGRAYEMYKIRNWYKKKSRKKDHAPKLKYFDTYVTFLDTTFQNSGYLFIEWKSRHSFFHLKHLVKSFTNIDLVSEITIDSLHQKRMKEKDFQTAIDLELALWKNEFEKKTRDLLQCRTETSIEELSMLQIPLDTIRSYLENFNYDGLANKIIAVYEDYAANILKAVNQLENQYQYSMSHELEYYQKIHDGNIPLSELLNELTDASKISFADTLAIFDRIQSFNLENITFRKSFANCDFEISDMTEILLRYRTNNKRSLEKIICKQFASEHLGYREETVIWEELMNEGPDFLNYCLFIQKENNPEEDDMYLVSFSKDSLNQWSHAHTAIAFNPFETNNSTLVPCPGGYLLPGQEQTIIVETKFSGNGQIQTIRRDNSIDDQYPTLIEVRPSTMPYNEPSIRFISHQHIETLSDSQRLEIDRLIKSEIEENPQLFQNFAKDTLYIIRKISHEINSWIQANQKLYRQNFYLRDINHDGTEEIIQYDISNGKLVSWSAHTLKENTYILMPENEVKGLLEDVSDVRNLMLFSQLNFPPQSSKP